MRFLQLKSTGTKSRKDGGKSRQPCFVTKDRKYGRMVEQEYIKITSPVLLTGLHGSGKSRNLSKLYENERAIWGAKILHPGLYFAAQIPLAELLDRPQVIDWYETQNSEAPGHTEFKKLKPHGKQQVFINYIKQTGCVVFIDDAHKLTGRKLQFINQCVQAAKIFVMTTTLEQRIPPSLRLHVLKRRGLQTFSQKTDLSYDATNILIWLIAAMLFIGGFYEMGIFLAALRAIASGNKTAKEA